MSALWTITMAIGQLPQSHRGCDCDTPGRHVGVANGPTAALRRRTRPAVRYVVFPLVPQSAATVRCVERSMQRTRRSAPSMRGLWPVVKRCCVVRVKAFAVSSLIRAPLMSAHTRGALLSVCVLAPDSIAGLAHRSVVRELACLPHHIISLAADAEEGTRPLPLMARFGNTDERLLAMCEEDGHLNVFRCGEECQKELLTPVRRWIAHRDAVFDMCWSKDDRSIITGSGDYRCCLWDTEKMVLCTIWCRSFEWTFSLTRAFRDLQHLISSFGGHSGSVKAVRYRDGNVFASAGRDGHIMIWDVRVANQRNQFGVLLKHPVAELRAAHSLRKQSNKRTPSRTPTGGGSSSSSASLTDVVNDSGGLGAARS